MIPVRLEWNRPTDGVEIALDEDLMEDYGDPQYFRPRSERTIPVTLELLDLENPVVLHFINCRKDEERLKFCERFGFLFKHDRLESDEHPWLFRYSESLAYFKLIQKWIEPDHIFTGSHEKIASWENSIETLMGHAHMRPTFAIGDKARPKMTLLADSLLGFMVMEVGLVFEVGAEIASCEHCNKLFLTGPMTGRRSTAKYCSDRCRVAALRARKKED